MRCSGAVASHSSEVDSKEEECCEQERQDQAFGSTHATITNGAALGGIINLLDIFASVVKVLFKS